MTGERSNEGLAWDIYAAAHGVPWDAVEPDDEGLTAVGALLSPLLDQLAALGAVRVERDALQERLDDSFPKSWAGFRAFLDEVYPDDIFPDDDRDLGPQFVVAARRLAESEARAAALQTAIDQAARDVKNLAELYLYDGDTDQPINDGYGAFICLADSFAAGVGAVPETREAKCCAQCDGTGTVYLDSDGDECAEPDSVREVACPHCGPVPETPEKPRKDER